MEQAIKGVLRRPLRSLLTALGTVVGVAAVIATLGLSATASRQVSGAFDAVRATEVVLRDARPGAGTPAFDQRSERKIRQLNGVDAVGRTWRLVGRDVRFGASLDDGVVVDVLAASPGALKAMGLEVRSGRTFSAFAERRDLGVVVLGAALVDRLGIGDHVIGSTIEIDDVPHTVIGIVDRAIRRPEVLTGALVPMAAAKHLRPASAEDAQEVLVATAPGAAQLVARQAPVALHPEDPDRVTAIAPPDPRNLRRRVEANLRTLALVLAALLLASGALGIGATSFAAVLERVPEFGLRRAVGARPRHIALQVLAESACTGLTGGLLGVSVGVLALVSLAAARGWAPIVPPAVLLLAPALGAVTGVVAGLIPAVRAARIEPVDALRR